MSAPLALTRSSHDHPYATRQQHGQELAQTIIRVPPELIAWYRSWAQSHDPPISQALAMRRALEEFKASHQG
jgi:hypothetical protein